MIYLLVLFFIIGSAVGSFLNVVIDRSTKRESFTFKRSYCDWCHRTLGAFDLVPIASFVALGARCRYCHRKLSWQYPAVETLCGLLFVGTFYSLAIGGVLTPATLIVYLSLIAIFIIVSVIDFKFSLIPTTLVFFAAFVVLFYNYFTMTSFEFVVSVLTAFLLALFFILLIVATRGRGMGTGDVPLVFLIGLILSWPLAAVSMFVSFFTGAAVSLLLLAFGKKRIGQTIPFGPFLAMGAITTMFWGQAILKWYLRLL
ncbi:MAG: prepilin peptidase [Candidatus Curtissbacteria bacterium]|nr:prepilin peptidase [Candidatus Curtissbacteria bacterium]